MPGPLGTAGRLAAAFVHSQLTPLVIVASIALGALAVLGLPREEEPQIIVPMVDMFVGMPGAAPRKSSSESPGRSRQLLWNARHRVPLFDVSPGQSLVIVRLASARKRNSAFVRLNQKLASNARPHPPGARADRQAAIHRRCADPRRHPVVAALRRRRAALLAAQLREAIAEVPDVSEVAIIGGRAAPVERAARSCASGGATTSTHCGPQARSRRRTRAPRRRTDRRRHTRASLEAGTRSDDGRDVRAWSSTSRSGRPCVSATSPTVVDRDARARRSYVRFYVARAAAARRP